VDRQPWSRGGLKTWNREVVERTEARSGGLKGVQVWR